MPQMNTTSPKKASRKLWSNTWPASLRISTCENFFLCHRLVCFTPLCHASQLTLQTNPSLRKGITKNHSKNKLARRVGYIRLNLYKIASYQTTFFYVFVTLRKILYHYHIPLLHSKYAPERIYIRYTGAKKDDQN